MKMRLDAVVIILSVLFIYGLGLVNRELINLGPFAQMVLIVLYFSLFSWYDQYKGTHLDRNYILIFSLLSIYIGAGLGYLFSGNWNGTIIGGLVTFVIAFGLLYIVRKPFYAWLDQRIGENDES